MPPRLLTDLRTDGHNGYNGVDLSDLVWVTPATMVGVAALAHRAVTSGTEFTLVGPRDAGVAGYLARMQLGKVLSDLDVRHRLRTNTRAYDRSNDLLEVRSVSTEKQANRLATLVHKNVGESDPTLADALFNSLAEVGDNVADHSRATGYMAAQKIPSRNELHIAVADGGVGLLHWLGPSRGAATDTQALDLALAGQSRYVDELDRGGGIVRALGLVAAMSGATLLASGGAWVRETGARRTRGTTRHPFPGAIFEARIPLGRRRA